MNRVSTTLGVVALLLTTAVADHHKETPWLDLQNCEICKCMGEDMEMMQHVTWETHKIDNGMLSASVIPEQYQAKMDELHKQMHAQGEKLQSGEKMALCGFCESWGELMKAGAKEQQIKTDFGMIGMLTSDDPQLVKKIHAHADRTIKEFAAYQEAAAKRQ
jgi:hypothetical protein